MKNESKKQTTWTFN